MVDNNGVATIPDHLGFVAGTLDKGGAEQQLYYMARVLREHGHRITVFCLTRGEHYEEPLRDLGVAIRHVGKWAWRPARVATLIAAVQRVRPQMLQSSHFYTNLYTALAAQAIRVPAIGALRNNVVDEMAANGVWGRWLLRFPMTKIANSQAAVATAARLRGSRAALYWLPNVVDTAAFQPAAQRPVSEHTRLLQVGRLAPQKNHPLFLQAIAKVAQTHPRLRATLIGSGPLRPELHLLCRQLFGDSPILAMQEATTNLLPYYQQADLVVLTSRYEGMPNVVLEAMACGCAVVATAAGDVGQVIEDGKTGKLVAPDCTPEALAQILGSLIAAPAQRQRLGTAAHRAVSERFSLATLYPRLCSLYGQILAKP